MVGCILKIMEWQSRQVGTNRLSAHYRRFIAGMGCKVIGAASPGFVEHSPGIQTFKLQRTDGDTPDAAQFSASPSSSCSASSDRQYNCSSLFEFSRRTECGVDPGGYGHLGVDSVKQHCDLRQIFGGSFEHRSGLSFSSRVTHQVEAKLKTFQLLGQTMRATHSGSVCFDVHDTIGEVQQ